MTRNTTRKAKLYSLFTVSTVGRRKCFKRASFTALPIGQARKHFQTRIESGVSGGMGYTPVPVVYALRPVKAVAA